MSKNRNQNKKNKKSNEDDEYININEINPLVQEEENIIEIELEKQFIKNKHKVIWKTITVSSNSFFQTFCFYFI